MPSRQDLIAKYKEGADVVLKAADGLTEAELDRRPSPSDWTAREVVHHLADAEVRSAVRLRQLLAEDEPTIQGYDEEHYARVLHYDRPIDGSLAVLVAVRRATSELLDLLSESDFERAGTHTESGRYSVDTWLERYAAHCHDHADQLARAARG